MNRFSKVQNQPDYIKDNLTGAIVHINSTKSMNERKRLNIEDQKQQEIEKLKNDVSDIKSLLYQLLEKNSNG